MGAVCGVFGALSTKLFTSISPDEQVASAAAHTDAILYTLGKRTNALYINQRRIHTLIKQIQRCLREDLSGSAYSVALSNTHIQISSALIHVNDHLGYVYSLLAGVDTDVGINLAMSENERIVVVGKTANLSKELQISTGKPSSYA